jgi:hypothetical protein
VDEIARILLDQPEDNSKGAFVFDMQIIVLLITVGWIYRHRALRREATQLFTMKPEERRSLGRDCGRQDHEMAY